MTQETSIGELKKRIQGLFITRTNDVKNIRISVEVDSHKIVQSEKILDECRKEFLFKVLPHLGYLSPDPEHIRLREWFEKWFGEREA